MDPTAFSNAYLNTVLKQNYASMPYLAMPMLGQPMMPANVIGNSSAHDGVVPAATIQPIVQPLPKQSRMTDAPSPPSTLSPPSVLPSTPSSRPLSMSSAHPTPSAQLSPPSPAPPAVKMRVAFTPAITKILRDWFNAHLDYPYPDDATKLILMEKTHLSRTQVNTWFTNRRRSYEQQHGHVKWVKMAAPACARTKRPAAQRDAAEPTMKMARNS